MRAFEDFNGFFANLELAFLIDVDKLYCSSILNLTHIVIGI